MTLHAWRPAINAHGESVKRCANCAVLDSWPAARMNCQAVIPSSTKREHERAAARVRICPSCDGEFTREPKGRAAVYCSTKCKNAKAPQQRDQKNARLRMRRVSRAA